MNRMIKNGIALMMAFTVGLYGLIPAARSESMKVASDGSPEEYLFYTFGDQGVIIDYYDGDFLEFSIPESIDGVPVVEIGAGAFANREGALCLELPRTICAIAEDAFANSTIELYVAPHSFAEAYAQQHGMDYTSTVASDTTIDPEDFCGQWEMEYYVSNADYGRKLEDMGLREGLRVTEDGYLELESDGEVNQYELYFVGEQLITYDNDMEIVLEMDEQGHLFVHADEEYMEFVREGMKTEVQEDNDAHYENVAGETKGNMYVGEWVLKYIADEEGLTSIDACDMQGILMIYEDGTGEMLQGERTNAFIWERLNDGIRISELNDLLTIDDQGYLHADSLVFERKERIGSFVDFYLDSMKTIEPAEEVIPKPTDFLTTAPIEAPIPQPTPIVTPELEQSENVDKDSSKNDIRAVQRKLILLGLMVSNADDGVYGATTTAAVKKFQQRVNEIEGSEILQTSGVVDPLTMAYLNSYVDDWEDKLKDTPAPAPTEAPDEEESGQSIDQNSPKESIRRVQEMLIGVSLLSEGSNDGVYGMSTVAAVARFQEWVNKLTQQQELNVTGIADAQTLIYLEIACREGMSAATPAPTPVPTLEPTSEPTPLPTEVPTPEPEPSAIAERPGMTITLLKGVSWEQINRAAANFSNRSSNVQLDKAEVKQIGNYVRVRWDEDANADAYAVYRERIADGMNYPVGITRKNYMHDISYLESGRYNYKVYALFCTEQGLTAQGIASSDVIVSKMRTQAVYTHLYYPSVIETDGGVFCYLESDDKKEYRDVKKEADTWENLIQLCVSRDMAVGLKVDGTVQVVSKKATKDRSYDMVKDWNDIVQIAFEEEMPVEGEHSILLALQADGKVKTAGNFPEDIAKEISLWENIIQVAVGEYGVYVGLTKYGDVEIVTDSDHRYYINKVQQWTDIVQVTVGDVHIAGLKSDGTVVAVSKRVDVNDVYEWNDIIQLCPGATSLYGLKADGTVLTLFRYEEKCEILDKWTETIQLSACDTKIVGLRENGAAIIFTSSPKIDIAQISDVGWFSEHDSIYAAYSTMQPMQKGDKGSDVVLLQRMLADCGYLTGTIDGVFGKNTETAVKHMQADLRLPETGIADAAFLELTYGR